MKLPFLLGLIMVIMILSITVIIALGANVPNELLIAFSSLSTYLIGVLSHNPTNGTEG